MTVETYLSNSPENEPTTPEEIGEDKQEILEKVPFPKIELRYELKTLKNDRVKIRSSRQATQVLRQLFNPDTIDLQEEFYILFLNNSNEVLAYYPHSKGGITGTMIDVRLVISTALISASVALILAHNHPSGSLMPSFADRAITKKLTHACEFFDIKMLDHIIVTKDGYFSFADESCL